MTKYQVPLAGVIGWPIAHSKSPALHGYWLSYYGIHGHYVPIGVRPDDLDLVLPQLQKMGFKGFNVTVPHKEELFKRVDILTDRAQKIGAVNTVWYGEDGNMVGDNSDGYGFIENLKQNAPNWEIAGKNTVIIGAGGASRAVIYALLQEGVHQITLVNRTMAKAEKLADEFSGNLKVRAFTDIPNAISKGCLLVNCSSLGMVGQPKLTIDQGWIDPTMLVTDLVYSPLETDLLRSAGLAGATSVDGLGMLLHQAAVGFEKWFGILPEVTPELRQNLLDLK